jgi:uncharacterized phage infection (PIP) family protein YhgE
MPVFNQPKGKSDIQTIIRELVDRSNTDTSRIRVLEQEMESLKNKLDSVSQNMSEEKKVAEFSNMIKQIIAEMKKMATTTKIKELESLIEIYNPMKSQFITKEEAERLVEERLEGK